MFSKLPCLTLLCTKLGECCSKSKSLAPQRCMPKISEDLQRFKKISKTIGMHITMDDIKAAHRINQLKATNMSTTNI